MSRLFFVAILLVIISSAVSAQSSFVDFQKGFMRVGYALKTDEDTLRKQFAAEGLTWPAKEIYLRSFKYDSQLEVWVRNSSEEPFKLFKTYKVCAMAGAIGPKRMQDDYQVPEGFYYINQFNPNSNYHLALGINYPNESDKVLSDSLRPGSGIYIHGSCITVGCIPLMDGPIEEVYLLAAIAKSEGEDFIPVHIFPIRFNRQKSMDYLTRVTKDDDELNKFEMKLKEVYDYFEENKKLPFIAVNKKGEYVIM